MSISAQDIVEIIKEVGALADVATLQNDKALSDQRVDSLDMANIFLNIEEKYQIKIEAQDAERLKSVDDIVSFINEKI